MPDKSDRVVGSFIRTARREQLVSAAITAIARLGYAGASISAIAREARVSRGVVTYHFADQTEVIDEVVAAVYARGRAAVLPGVAEAGARGAGAALAAFVTGSLAFYDQHRDEMKALDVIFHASPTTTRESRPEHQREMAELTALLRDGQRSGAFRVLDAPLTAEVVRAALDAAARHVATGGDHAHWARELSTLVDRATAS